MAQVTCPDKFASIAGRLATSSLTCFRVVAQIHENEFLAFRRRMGCFVKICGFGEGGKLHLSGKLVLVDKLILSGKIATSDRWVTGGLSKSEDHVPHTGFVMAF